MQQRVPQIPPIIQKYFQNYSITAIQLFKLIILTKNVYEYSEKNPRICQLCNFVFLHRIRMIRLLSKRSCFSLRIFVQIDHFNTSGKYCHNFWSNFRGFPQLHSYTKINSLRAPKISTIFFQNFSSSGDNSQVSGGHVSCDSEYGTACLLAACWA